MFKPSSSFSTDHSNAVQCLLQCFFVPGSVFSDVPFVCHCVFLISPFFAASGRMSFMIRTFIGCLPDARRRFCMDLFNMQI